MKILSNLIISGGWLRSNGDAAQVGDSVRLYLDDGTEIVGTIEFPIAEVNCGQDRAYRVAYESEDIIRAADVADGVILDSNALLEDRVEVLENGIVAYTEIFGAKGDGSEQTESIQAAIDYVSAKGGGEVRFGAGTYVYSSLTINASKVSLIGQGAATLMRRTNTESDQHGIIIKMDDASRIEHIRIERLAFNPMTDAPADSYEIFIPYFRTVYLSNLVIGDIEDVIGSGNSKVGGVFHLGNDGSISQYSTCLFIENMKGMGYKQFLWGRNVIDFVWNGSSLDSDAVEATHFIMEGICASWAWTNVCAGSSASVAPHRAGANWVNMKGAVLELRDHALNPGGIQVPNYSTFVGCFFDSQADALVAPVGIGLQFSNCWFSTRPGVGVRLGPTTNTFQFANCQSCNNGSEGWVIGGTNHVINGCKAVGNNSIINGSPGFRISSNAINIRLVMPHTLSTDGLVGGNQSTALIIDSGAIETIIDGDLLIGTIVNNSGNVRNSLLLSPKTTPLSFSQYDFDIPIGATSIELEVYARSTHTEDFVDLRLGLNGDFAANYATQELNSYENSANGSEIVSGTSALIGKIPASTASSGDRGAVTVKLMGVNSGGWTRIHSESAELSAGNMGNRHYANIHKATAAVSTIRLFCVGGDMNGIAKLKVNF